jgi:hypothetical protein
MIRLPKSALATGALAVSVVSLALTVPRSAHAVAAALVQLTNTVASPGNTQDVSRQAVQIVNLYCPAPATIITQTCAQPPKLTAFSTPANQSLVITSVDITGESSDQWGIALAAGPNINDFVTLWNWFGSGTNTQHFNYTTGLVIPPNSTIYVEALNTPGQAYVQLQGYLTYQ